MSVRIEIRERKVTFTLPYTKGIVSLALLQVEKILNEITSVINYIITALYLYRLHKVIYIISYCVIMLNFQKMGKHKHKKRKCEGKDGSVAVQSCETTGNGCPVKAKERKKSNKTEFHSALDSGVINCEQAVSEGLDSYEVPKVKSKKRKHSETGINIDDNYVAELDHAGVTDEQTCDQVIETNTNKKKKKKKKHKTYDDDTHPELETETTNASAVDHHTAERHESTEKKHKKKKKRSKRETKDVTESPEICLNDVSVNMTAETEVSKKKCKGIIEERAEGVRPQRENVEKFKTERKMGKVAGNTQEAAGSDTSRGETEEPKAMGQWSTAKFDDSDKQLKFFKLLGGFKNKADPSAFQNKFGLCKKFELGKNSYVQGNNNRGGGGNAMNQQQQDVYTKRLESEYERALTSNLNRGIGLGFERPPEEGKKFYVDTKKSNSVKFDD